MKLLHNSPLQSKKLLLVGMVSLFGLIHGSASISHQMVSTIILLLGENIPKAFPGGICLQQERFLARSDKSLAAVDYTPIGVEPHEPTRGV